MAGVQANKNSIHHWWNHIAALGVERIHMPVRMRVADADSVTIGLMLCACLIRCEEKRTYRNSSRDLSLRGHDHSPLIPALR